MIDLSTEGRLPIVIGVAGHRHLNASDRQVYKDRVGALFIEFKRRYPATPLRVISALAEGADCLVAEEALAAGCELVVPLPLSVSEYERDFPESVAGFRAILKRVAADNVFVIAPQSAGDLRDASHDADARDRQYAASGAFVAMHCHFLIALWDGRTSALQAGTGAVVRLKLHGASAADEAQFRVLDAPDTGPVFHVQTHRSTAAAGELGQTRWLYPQDANEDTFKLIFSRIDRFNSDVGRSGIAQSSAATATQLLAEAVEPSRVDRDIATVFGVADQLAGRYRRITHRVLRTVLLLAAILALTYDIYAEILPWRAIPILYLTIFAAITLVYLWHRRVDAQGRFLDYRAVAEGLRVQFYWRMSGLKDDVFANYLRKQLDELRWIREALRGISAAPPPSRPQIDVALSNWVGGQSEYYRVRARMQARRLHRVEWASATFIAAGLLSAASLVVLWHALEHFDRVHHWVVLLMGFAPVAAALWEAYGEKAGLRAQANQYARFAGVFRRAESHREQLAAAPRSKARTAAEQELIRELGREALMENGDWVLLLRERPIVVPKG